MENLIQGWNVAGLQFFQDVDVNIRCNNVSLNRRTVDFARNAEPLGPTIRFRTNLLEVNEDGDAVVRFENGAKMKFGPFTANRGKNLFRTVSNVPFLRDDEPPTPGGGVVDALNNWWYLDEDLLDEFDDIGAEMDPEWTPTVPGADVNFGSHNEQDPEAPCWPAVARLAGGGAVTPPTENAPAASDLPAETRLMGPTPNPAHGRTVEVRLDVGAWDSGSYEVAVFDVAGRRVRTIHSGVLPGGRHSFLWNRHDGRGSAVVPGVYFVRVVGPDYSRTERVILVH